MKRAEAVFAFIGAVKRVRCRCNTHFVMRYEPFAHRVERTARLTVGKEYAIAAKAHVPYYLIITNDDKHVGAYPAHLFEVVEWAPGVEVLKEWKVEIGFPEEVVINGNE